MGFIQFSSVLLKIGRKLVKTDKVVNDKGVVKGTKEVKDSFVLESCMATINKWVEKLNKVDSKDWTSNTGKRLSFEIRSGTVFFGLCSELY